MIYVPLKILFPCLRVLCLADSNKLGIDKVFYYARMTKISIIKSSSDLDNKELLLVSSLSSFKVCISSDSDTWEEYNIDNDDPEIIYSDMLKILTSSVYKLWHKRQIHTNTDFSVNGWMLCVIPHIRKDAKYHSDSGHRKQVNNVIKTLFHGESEDEMVVTPDIFWTKYTEFDNKIGSFDADEFIWKSKYIRDGNIHLWYQKYPLPCIKVLGFVAYRVTSKVLGIGTAERYWGDVKTIKYGKRYAIRIDVSEKQSIVYTYACIESARIEQYHSEKKLMKIVQVIPRMKRMMLLVNS